MLDPTPRLVARTVPPVDVRMSGAVCCVYRVRNAETVRLLAGETAAVGVQPILWALDEAHPELARWTVGVGAGSRQALLNRLLRAAPDEGWIVLADDDVRGRTGWVREFLVASDAAGFGIAQPAHEWRSAASTSFVFALPLAWARTTGFVEVGPFVAIAPTARHALLPLDESLGMGWGQDYLWARACREAGITMAIVDAVRMRHAGSVTAYDRDAAYRALGDAMERSGFTTVDAVHTVTRRWPVWRPPPWRHSVAIARSNVR